jgi:predicted transcriptional regulator
MVMGEKIKDPLNHDFRYILLNIILKYKRTGIRLVELSKITGKKNHSLRHHLDILEQKKLIYTKRETHQLYYFPDSHIPKHTRIGHPLENELRSKMLETILNVKQHGIHVSALYKKLKVPKNRTLKALRILKHFELINMEQGDNKTYCYPTPKTHDLVKYVNAKIDLFKEIHKEDGVLIRDLKGKIDQVGLANFKLCVYTKRYGRDTFYYLTPFVERILEKSNA